MAEILLVNIYGFDIVIQLTATEYMCIYVWALGKANTPRIGQQMKRVCHSCTKYGQTDGMKCLGCWQSESSCSRITKLATGLNYTSGVA